MPDRPPRQPRKPPPPLDAAALERMALRYVERFATTRGKLVDYLRRKVRERGWEGEAADPVAIAGRVSIALRQAKVGEEDAAAVRPGVDAEAVASAHRFARRKRIGPYAIAPVDRDRRQKQLAQMVRAGHGFALARALVEADPGEIGEDPDLTHCDDDEPC
jgi:regulatory protein